ncbi:MAG: hypothetical protein HFI12_02455 [Lachnospiraceae bacterium]|jgi:hypothetical protein|nr:hypothetical protein [Lachnospiraceae bacterium]
MKYVAFLDILGFKETLKKMKQSEAAEYISKFSSTAFEEWNKIQPTLLEGYIVSDSFIIYSKSCSDDSLKMLLLLVDSICKKEFSENSILIRGAIASGDFERIEAKELASLKKGLIVGQAYIDAYLLEGTIKMPGIVLSESVYKHLSNIDEFGKSLFDMKKDKENVLHILRYLSIDYLLEEMRLEQFVHLATTSKWIPHYYNAIYFAFARENNDKKVQQVFANIFNLVCKGNPCDYWRDIDKFIRNAFHPDVDDRFQTRLLKYLRKKIF